MKDREREQHRAFRNDFIKRCFRDQADTDYISARANWRLGLSDKFYWAGEQSLEKYLKAILLYHNRSAKGLWHDLTKALEAVEDLRHRLGFQRPIPRVVGPVELLREQQVLRVPQGHPQAGAGLVR